MKDVDAVLREIERGRLNLKGGPAPLQRAAPSIADILNIEDKPPRERVRLYLLYHMVRPKDDVLDVLANCDSGSEVWLALGFTSLPGCKVDGDSRFVAGRCSLTLQEPCGRYRIDAVLRCPVYSKPTAIEIDGDAWHKATLEQQARDVRKDAALLNAGYRVMRQRADDVKPFARQLWWTLGNTPSLWEGQP